MKSNPDTKERKNSVSNIKKSNNNQQTERDIFRTGQVNEKWSKDNLWRAFSSSFILLSKKIKDFSFHFHFFSMKSKMFVIFLNSSEDYMLIIVDDIPFFFCLFVLLPCLTKEHSTNLISFNIKYIYVYFFHYIDVLQAKSKHFDWIKYSKCFTSYSTSFSFQTIDFLVSYQCCKLWFVIRWNRKWIRFLFIHSRYLSLSDRDNIIIHNIYFIIKVGQTI